MLMPMATRTTMNVSLTPELNEFVASRVTSGRYQSSSEVVREGLRLLQDHETALEAVRQKIAAGLEQAKRDELLDGEEVMARMMERHDKRLCAANAKRRG